MPRERPMRAAASAMNLFAVLCLTGTLSGQPAAAQGESLQKRFSNLYQAAAKEGEVILYTDGRQEQAQRLSEYWKTNFPDVNLRIVPKSSPALIAQIETERAAGQHRVDVSHMSQPSVAALWKQRSLLPALPDRKLRAAAPDNADADGAFYTLTSMSCRPPTTACSRTRRSCRRA